MQNALLLTITEAARTIGDPPAGRPARLTVSRVRVGMSDGTRRLPGVRVQLRSTEYVRAAADEYPGARPAVADRTKEHVAEVGFLNVADDEA